MQNQYTVTSYLIWELLARGGSKMFRHIVRRRRPRATAQNNMSDIERQLFDCSQITYEIIVLLPEQ